MPNVVVKWIAVVCVTLSCFVLGCTSGSSGSSNPPPPVPPAAPTIASIAPTTVPAGTTTTTITVTGTGFTASTVITVGGTAETTTYVSSTQVTAVVPSSQLATGGNAAIVASNGSSSASTSSVSLEIDNPVPAITQVSPAMLPAGAASALVTVTGSGFVASTTIQVNGAARTTSFVSATQLTFTLTASDLSASGSINVTAVNPAPGGGSSAASSVAVNNPAPGQISLTPDLVITGTTTPTTISVTGTNFLPLSTVQIGSSPRTTAYVSSTQLTFQLTPADEATTTNLNVAVVNPTPGGGISAPALLAVADATSTPVLSSITPNTIVVNSPATSFTVFGSGLTERSTLIWNTTHLQANYGSCYTNSGYSPCLTATVPASLLTSVGTVNVTASTPTATPSTSNAVQVAITYPPAPTLTYLSVTAGPTNTAVSIDLTGTNFIPTSTVLLNGSTVPSSYVSPTRITANVPASSLATPGVLPVTVSTPAPGGGVSSAQYFTAYISIPNNSMVYNPANGLFYLSVPSAAGAPYGNTIVPIDPLTGNLGTPIPVGSEPNRLAITSDGKYLWVALDGAAAVRQVDLTTGIAGLQFPIGPAGSSTNTVAALAALPGSPNSVVVSTYYGGYTVDTGAALAIYDSGVARTNVVTFPTYNPFPWALLVNGTTNEIYGPGSVFTPGNYNTYSYDANGVTQKFSAYSSLNYASSNNDDIQIVGNTLYTDYGQGVNAETGALLGTFYSTATTVAQGSITVDTTLNKAFILQGSSGAFGGDGSGLSGATLQAFNTADYSATSDTPINASIPVFRANYQYAGPTSSRLTRWGSDGLAFRGSGGFVSLRSNLVKDLSSVNADVAVSIMAAISGTTGTNTTFTATVTNNGPSAASSVSLVAEIPSSGVLVSVAPSTGSCLTGTTVVCNLGGLANGASANVVFTVLPVSSGTASLSAQVSASETDTALSNNSASASVTITGSAYNLAPALTAISPEGIASGAADTQITLTGTGFSSGATVQLNGTALQTSFVSGTQLTATVPSANLTTLGWAKITVSNPSPGGGTSASVPLYVFSVLAVNASEMVYDPYSRKLMAGLTTGTSTLAAKSLVAITPETASVGTPVVLSGTPSQLAITSDGQFVYALLPDPTAGSIARFNMLNQQVDFTATGFQPTGYNTGLRDLATQPGYPNTIAVDEGEYPGTSIFDFDATTKVATRRGAATGLYGDSTCLIFPDPSHLFMVGGDLVESYSVTANGLLNGSYPYYTSATLQGISCAKVSGNLLVGQAGGVASLSGGLPVQAGTIEGLPFVTNYGSGVRDFVPDAPLGHSFYLTSMSSNNYSAIFDSVTAFDLSTYMPSTVLTLPFSAFEAANSQFTGVDVQRWGQDGLAVLSSGGTIYLLRGPVVVPGLLGTSSAATLTSSSSATLAHGSSNTLLTLTGTNFQPGVAITWNGSYRTTTWVSSTKVTVAIPSSDLAAAGTASLVATNPGATASAAINITVQ